jgi:hypothetical protein
MLENIVNRTFHVVYPVAVFLALVLSWNTVGQVRGNADFGFPELHLQEPEKPASTQQSCAVERPKLLMGQTCHIDEPRPGKLLDIPENKNQTFGSTDQASTGLDPVQSQTF